MALCYPYYIWWRARDYRQSIPSRGKTPMSAGVKPTLVDIVIPVYREQPSAVSATLCACLKQTYSVTTIFVIDDCSPEPFSLPEWPTAVGKIRLLRLAQNSGISAARNRGLAESAAQFVACVNVEVLPEPNWLGTCVGYLERHPKVGAVYTRMVPADPTRLATRWRMRFLETKFGDQSGPSPFAPGHAVAFRRAALDSINGYDVRYRVHHEDSNVCTRMKSVGWETHYIADSRCISIQQDSVELCAVKELRESYWYSPSESSLGHLYIHLSKWSLIRAGRNVVSGRWSLLPLDVAIWARALCIATVRTVQYFVPFLSPKKIPD